MSDVATRPCWKKRPVRNILIIALFAEDVDVVARDVGPELGDPLGDHVFVEEHFEAGLREESHGSR